MTEANVVFFQLGKSDFLRYCVEQSKSCGNRTIVIGDDAAKSSVDAEFYHVHNLQHGVDRFRKIYTHISVNSPDYELLCFERWFYLYNLSLKLNTDIFYADSDVLVYPGLNYLPALLKEAIIFNVPWINYFRNADSIKYYLDFLIYIYSDKERTESLARKYEHAGTPHLSDMCLFYEMGEVRAKNTANLRDYGAYLGFDNNIRDVVGFKSRHHHKDIRFINGIPFCERDVGGNTRFFSLHFQGISKPLMQQMHTITNENALESLRDLSFWFGLPGHSTVQGHAETEALFIEGQRAR